ncbi:hypothetical protein D9M69_652540 [compost metagenome]
MPLAGIGVEKIAVQAIAGDFIVETQAVVTHAASARLDHFGMHASHELGLAQALVCQLAGGDARDQAGGRMRQDVVAGLTVDVQRHADFIEFFVGTNSGDLQRAVAARIDTGGFVVVPEQAGGHGGFL